MPATGIMPVINLARCTKCGVCVPACPEGVLVMEAGGPVFAQADQCTYCASCEDACPENAIRCEMEFVWEEDIQ
jgi:NAD-dependent dihydropyrimidine dehydrogenase PreA subunit